MTPIFAKSRATAWLGAIQHLLKCSPHRDYQLVLSIADPMRRDARDTYIENELDALLRAAEVNPLTTVAGTIFPADVYRRHSARGVYEIYPNEEYPAIESSLEWGTYAYRLVRARAPDGSLVLNKDGEPFNPLKSCIDKMRVQLATRGPKSACYELSVVTPLDIPLYNGVVDESRTMGGPCLSHLSFKIRDHKELLLTVMYRSHYYVTKALGNLLGLARLQAFVCEQTGLVPGEMVCISTFAQIDTSKKLRTGDLKSLVSRAVEFQPPMETTA